MQRHHPHRAGNHRADRDDRRHHFGADERRRRPLLRALERNLINTHEPDLRAVDRGHRRHEGGAAVRRRQSTKPEITAMSAAFLHALMRWAAHGDRSGNITIPTGIVDAAELARVVIALKCAGRIRNSQNRQRASR
jgi:hypothetical protein